MPILVPVCKTLNPLRVQGAAAGVRAQVGAFKMARDNLSEGLRFYMSLQEAIVQLGQQIGDFCLTRRIQRCPYLPFSTPSSHRPSISNTHLSICIKFQSPDVYSDCVYRCLRWRWAISNAEFETGCSLQVQQQKIDSTMP